MKTDVVDMPLVLSTLLFAVSCASAGTNPSEMSAVDHDSAAAREADLASRPQTRRSAAQHWRLARAHRRAATALLLDEDELCTGQREEDATASSCPIGPLKVVQDVDGGVFISPVDETNVEGWTERLKCLVADADGRHVFANCPLVDGLRVLSEPGGATLELRAGRSGETAQEREVKLARFRSSIRSLQGATPATIPGVLQPLRSNDKSPRGTP